MREASAYLIVAIRSASELPADGAPFAINLYLKCKQESGRRQGFSNDRVGGGLPRPPEWVPRFIMTPPRWPGAWWRHRPAGMWPGRPLDSGVNGPQRYFEQALRLDWPPPTLCYATPNSLPATQGQRSGDAPAHQPAFSRGVVDTIGLLLAIMPILPFFQLHSGSIPAESQ